VSAGVREAALSEVFGEQRRRLFALCYRMTGSAADADDLVQSTFERALARPPRDTHRPWGPWLTRVAVNLSRDHRRRRRRQDYVGPWLPEPIDTDAWLEELAAAAEPRLEPADTAGRYDLLESVSYAFLVALEALTPTQRAVLLLRDVLEYSARETAEALDMSEGNVRTSHHRARRAMAAYDTARPPEPRPDEEVRDLVGRFMLHMGRRDAAALEEMLHEDVLHLADGAGKVSAARIPVRGRERVARLHAGLGKGIALPRIAFTRLNGQLAILADYPDGAPKPHLARRFAILAQPTGDGRLRRIYLVADEAKLRAVDFEGAAWLAAPAPPLSSSPSPHPSPRSGRAADS
jgi:RNA polymerase sigma factor (sigma-70 family)